MNDDDLIMNEHDLIAELRDLTVGGYDFEVKFTNIRDREGTLWPIIEVSDVTEPGREIIEGQYWFYDNGDILQVL